MTFRYFLHFSQRFSSRIVSARQSTPLSHLNEGYSCIHVTWHFDRSFSMGFHGKKNTKKQGQFSPFSGAFRTGQHERRALVIVTTLAIFVVQGWPQTCRWDVPNIDKKHKNLQVASGSWSGHTWNFGSLIEPSEIWMIWIHLVTSWKTQGPRSLD